MWLSLDGLFSFVTSSMSISPTSYPSGITGRLNGVETLNVASFGCPSPHLANCVLILTLSWGTVAERDPWGSVVNHLMESEQVDGSLFPTPPCPSNIDGCELLHIVPNRACWDTLYSDGQGTLRSREGTEAFTLPSLVLIVQRPASMSLSSHSIASSVRYMTPVLNFYSLNKRRDFLSISFLSVSCCVAGSNS